MANKNYAYLKKRILDVLDEYSENEGGLFTADGTRQVVFSRLPDAVNSSLVRMYESLYIGLKTAKAPVLKPAVTQKFDGVCDKIITFTAQSERTGMLFDYILGGNFEILDEDGNVIFARELISDGIFENCRILFETQKGSSYTVKASQGLKLMNVYVYNAEHLCEDEAVPDFGCHSICLPKDFNSFEEVNVKGIGNVDTQLLKVCGNYAYIPDSICDGDTAHITYRARPPFFEERIDEEYEFELSDLAFEALVCLAASELCRQEQAGLYTRLLYKYTDYCDALCARKTQKGRNTFFKRNGRVR